MSDAALAMLGEALERVLTNQVKAGALVVVSSSWLPPDAPEVARGMRQTFDYIDLTNELRDGRMPSDLARERLRIISEVL